MSVDTGRIVLVPFHDLNGDGVQQWDDLEEDFQEVPGLALYRDDGDGVFNIELDQPEVPDYWYFYEDLPFGRYFAAEQGFQVPGYSKTVLTNPAVQVFDVTAEDPEHSGYFGYWYTSFYDVSVFQDANANGIRDIGEGLLPGTTTVNIKSPYSEEYFPAEITDGMSDPDWWSYREGPRTFSFGTQREDKLVATTSDPLTVDFESTSRTHVEFGVTTGASVEMYVYSDTTGDGRTADDKPVWLSQSSLNVKITGQAISGQTVDTDLKSRSSNAFRVEDLLPGSYTFEVVSEDENIGLFSQEPLVRRLNIASGDELVIDFAVFMGHAINESIGSLKHNSDQISYAGITVELFRDDGDEVFDPQTDQLLASTTTDAKAGFTLPGFGPGSYFVASRMGETYTPREIQYAKIFEPESNEEFPGYLSVPRSSIQVEVYADANRNGRFEPRELGLEGVTLTLEGFDKFGNFVSKTQTTRFGGIYTFASLLPGTYSVLQEQPAGYEDGIASAVALSATPSSNRIDNIVVGIGENLEGYRFGEFGSPEYRTARPDEGDHVGVYEPTASGSYLRRSNSDGKSWVAFQYGGQGAQAIAGDWDKDGYDAIGLFDPANGVFRLKNVNRNSAADVDVTPFVYGGSGFVAISGDWNSDGVDTVGVFDPVSAGFYLRNSNDSGIADAGQFTFGRPGWIPIAGDWDGDGFDGIGVYDPQTAMFYLRNTLSAGAPDIEPFNYGMPGWKPIAGDWNDDGIVTIGAYNPQTATFFLRDSNSTGVADTAPFNYGAANWDPIVGDWDSYNAAVLERPYFSTVAIVSDGDYNLETIFFGHPTSSYLKGDSAGLKEAIAAEAASAVVTEEAVPILADSQPPWESDVPGGSISIWNLEYVAPDLQPEDESSELLDLLAADQLTQ